MTAPPLGPLAGATGLTEFLVRQGFVAHPFDKNQVGHLIVTGTIAGFPTEMIVDTGAASTVVDVEWCRAHGIPIVDTGRTGGGAGGVNLPIFALGPVELTLNGEPLRANGVFALDISHVNAGLKMRGASSVHGILGADVLAHHHAVLDYAAHCMFLKRLQ